MGGPRLAVLDEEEDDGEMALAESDWLKLLRLSSFSRVRSPSILAILGRDNKKYKNQCLVTPLRWWLIHSSIWSPAKHLMRGEDFVGHTWKMYKNVIMQWAAGLLKVGLSCLLSKKWKTSYICEVRKTFENVLAYYDSKVGTVGALLLMKGFFSASTVTLQITTNFKYSPIFSL